LQREIQVLERPPFSLGLLLSLQHLLAMVDSTVLVPRLFHIDPSIVLLMNGLGTIFYLILCRGLISAYLGSSFAFISPVLLILPTIQTTMPKHLVVLFSSSWHY